MQFKFYYYLVRNKFRSKEIYNTGWVDTPWHELKRKSSVQVLLIRTERRNKD